MDGLGCAVDIIWWSMFKTMRFVVVLVLVLCVALLCALSGGKLNMKMQDIIEFWEPAGEMDMVVMRMTGGIFL
jgi:hypothetical protein